MKRIFFLSSVLMLFACKREQAEATDTERPQIKLTSPANNQSFTVGQTVGINARITDNDRLDEVHLEITNKTTGTFITHEHFVPDSAGYSLSRTFTISSAATYRIKVEAVDKKGNDAEVEIAISAN